MSVNRVTDRVTDRVTIKVDADTKDAEAALERVAKLNKAAHAQRSGWKSTKLHLALIVMALLTAGWLTLGDVGRGATFGEWALGLATAAGIFSTTRVAESFAPRRVKADDP